MIALLLLALISSPIGEVSEAVDCIEANTVHNCEGVKSLEQTIFWGWRYGGVRAWTLEKGHLSYCQTSGLWTFAYFDSSDKLWRRLVSPNYSPTWTSHDREREDLKKLPENQRVKLIGRQSKPTVSPVEEE